MYGRLVQFVVIKYIFPFLVCLDLEKSGNPGSADDTASRMLPSSPVEILDSRQSNKKSGHA
jgi:hypothetical protein